MLMNFLVHRKEIPLDYDASLSRMQDAHLGMKSVVRRKLSPCQVMGLPASLGAGSLCSRLMRRTSCVGSWGAGHQPYLQDYTGTKEESVDFSERDVKKFTRRDRRLLLNESKKSAGAWNSLLATLRV